MMEKRLEGLISQLENYVAQIKGLSLLAPPGMGKALRTLSNEMEVSIMRMYQPVDSDTVSLFQPERKDFQWSFQLKNPSGNIEAKYPEIHVDLKDANNNNFYLIGKVSKALQKDGQFKGAELFLDEAKKTNSYQSVIAIAHKYVDVNDE